MNIPWTISYESVDWIVRMISCRDSTQASSQLGRGQRYVQWAIYGNVWWLAATSDIICLFNFQVSVVSPRCIWRRASRSHGLRCQNGQLSYNSSRNEVIWLVMQKVSVGGFRITWASTTSQLFSTSFKRLRELRGWCEGFHSKIHINLGKKFRAVWGVIKRRIDSATGLRKRHQSLGKSASQAAFAVATISLTPSPIFSSFLYVSMISTRPQLGESWQQNDE